MTTLNAQMLLPCPFCGGDKEGAEGALMVIEQPKGWFKVLCILCMAEGPDVHQNIEACRERWNARDPRLARRVIELEEALEVFSKALGKIADKDTQRWPDNETIEHSGAAEEITWGDLRKARAALKGEGE